MEKNQSNTGSASDGKLDPLLSQPVDEKNYLQGANQSSGVIIPAPDFTFEASNNAIEEDAFVSPDSINANRAAKSNGQQKDTQESSREKTGNTSQQQTRHSEPFNPSMNDMKPKEKEMSAKQLAKFIVSGYEWLHQFPNKWVRINMNSIRKLERKGKVDMLIAVKYEGEYITVKQLIENYNESVKNIFTVDQEFKDDIIPPLTRELEKAGAGLTDMQTILMTLGKDLAPKFMTGFQCIQIMKDINNSLIEATEASRKASGMGATPAGVPLREPTMPIPVPLSPQPEPEPIRPVTQPQQPSPPVTPQPPGDKNSIRMDQNTLRAVHGDGDFEVETTEFDDVYNNINSEDPARTNPTGTVVILKNDPETQSQSTTESGPDKVSSRKSRHIKINPKNDQNSQKK